MFVCNNQKSQKTEEEQAKKTAEDQFKQYKAKAKVILQKQKDDLTQANEQIKELQPLRDEVKKLKEQLKSLSTENWAEKYQEIEKQISTLKTELQNKKLESAEIQSKLLLKERELSIIKEEFEKEKEEIRNEFESEKVNSKKKFQKKLEDYRVRAREMLEEKDKQLSIARSRLKNARNGSVSPHPAEMNNNYNYSMDLKFDKETQTEYQYVTDSLPPQYQDNNIGDQDNYNQYQDEYAEQIQEVQEEEEQVMMSGNVDGGNETVGNNASDMITSTDDLVAALQPPLNATVINKPTVDENKDNQQGTSNGGGRSNKDNIDQVMSSANIAAMARMQVQRDAKVREFQDRLRRLQELLNKSEEEHKRKDSELEYFRGKFAQIEQAQDVKKTADNSEYLKNALLQYFDGNIDSNVLVKIVAKGLNFSEEETKKAQGGKLLNNDAGIGGYVKSWWG